MHRAKARELGRREPLTATPARRLQPSPRADCRTRPRAALPYVEGPDSVVHTRDLGTTRSTPRVAGYGGDHELTGVDQLVAAVGRLCLVRASVGAGGYLPEGAAHTARPRRPSDGAPRWR